MMFSEETVKAVSAYFSIIASVEEALKDAFVIEPRSRQGQKILFFKEKDGIYLMGFGLWHELWNRFQQPLWFGVHSGWTEAVFSRFTQKNSGRFVDFEGYRLCFADPGPAGPEGAAAAIVKILRKQLADLAGS